MKNPLKSYIFWLIIIGIIVIFLAGYFTHNLFEKKQDIICSEENINNFIKSDLAPSSYFGGELKNHFESSNGLMNIKYDSTNDREILTIYSKPGDNFESWETYGESMKPASGKTFVGLNLLNFSEKDLYIGDVIVVKKVDEIYPNGTIVSQKLIRHRIISIQNINGTTYYQTQGDNNKFPDKNGLIDNNLWIYSDIYAKEIGGFY